MKLYVLNLYKRNLNNPLQTGNVSSVEGDSLIEICAKFVLMIAQLQQELHDEAIEKLKQEFLKDDDIPF